MLRIRHFFPGLFVHATAACGLLVLSGCSLQAGGGRPVTRADLAEVRQEQIRTALWSFEDFTSDRLESASQELEQTDSSRRNRKAALTWRSLMLDRIRQGLDNHDALGALLDTWAQCTRIREYLEKGDGRTLFHDNQTIAVNAAGDILQQIQNLARTVLGADKYERLQPQISEYARRYPIRGVFSDSGAPEFTVEPAGQSAVAAILGIPLTGLTLLGNLLPGATTIGEIPGAAERFTTVVQGLPEEARWQLELLVYQLEESDAVTRALASMEQFSSSSAELAETAKALPADLRVESERFVRTVGDQEPAVHKMLTDARQTVEQLDGALQKSQEVVGKADEATRGLREAAQAWQATADAVTLTVREIRTLQTGGYERPATSAPGVAAPRTPDAPATAAQPPGDEHGFNPNDYTRAANALTTAAAEIRDLLRDVRGMSDSKETSAALGQVQLTARTALDHAAWRAAQLIGLFFVLALAYRLISQRLVPARARA